MHQLALAAEAAVVTPFQFHTHTVRVVTRDGEPWFVAADVADALGYASAKDAARNLSESQKGRQIVPTLSADAAGRGGGDQTVTIVNESGLYRLVLRSRKPEAIAFSDWVTGEVLPSIRKTGSYGKPAIDYTAARAQAAAVGLAAEHALFTSLLAGECNQRVMAWQTHDGKAGAKVITQDAVCMSFALMPDAIERDGLAAGATNDQLLAVANACINRVRNREDTRIAHQKRRAVA